MSYAILRAHRTNAVLKSTRMLRSLGCSTCLGTSAVHILDTPLYRNFSTTTTVNKFSPSSIYKNFVKKSLATENWERIENSKEFDEESVLLVDKIKKNARNLKESLAVPPGQDHLDYPLMLKNLIALLDLLPSSDKSPSKNVSYAAYKSIIETSVLLLMGESKSENSHFQVPINDIIRIYTALVRNGSKDLMDSSIIPDLYFVIDAAKDRSSEQLVKSRLDYFFFLEAQQHPTKAVNLLKWVVQKLGNLSESQFLQIFNAVDLPHIKYACLPLLFSSYKDQGHIPSQTIVLSALHSLASSGLQDPNIQNVFSGFVKNNVIEDSSQHSNLTALKFILQSYLSSRGSKGAKEFLTIFDNSEAFFSLQSETDTEFLKFLAMSFMKYSYSKETVNRLINLPRMSNDRDLQFFSSLYFEHDSKNLLSHFDTALGNGYNITDHAVNNAIEILLQTGHSFADLQKLLEELSEKFGLEASIETREILLTNALTSNNIELALKIFEDSLKEGCQWNSANGSYLKHLDNLLIAMADVMSSDVQKVFKTYLKVKMFTNKLGEKATASLLKLFLSYNYVDDSEKFLEHEMGVEPEKLHPNSPELQDIYSTLYDYALNCSNYKNAWTIYGLSEKYFYAPYESYYHIMKHFCDLVRPDAALLIFKSMRLRSKKLGAKPPNEEIYTLLFHEFGKYGYQQGVSELHIFFKMDTTVDESVPLLNEIMQAYCELEDFENTVDLWQEVKSFPSGPSSDSYNIILKLCTKVSIADLENMWNNLLTSGTPDDSNFRQYIIGNCYHGFYARALDIAQNMPVEPSKETIASLYNWTLIESRKEEVSEWAKSNYPEKWTKLLEDGSLKSYLLEEANPDNDSEVHRRHAVNQKVENDGKPLLPDTVL